VTTREFLQRVEAEATKRVDAARRQLAKTDPKDTVAIEQLRREEKTMQDLLVYANNSLLNSGLK